MTKRCAVVVLSTTLALAGCGSSLTTPIPESRYLIHARVPADARVLTVTRGYPGDKPSLSAITTDPVKVRRIAVMLDRLHLAPPGIVNCPNIRPAPTLTFTFRAQRNGPVLARASTLASGPHGECPGITFKAPGRAQQGLLAQPTFLRDAQRVLGVHLMTK